MDAKRAAPVLLQSTLGSFGSKSPLLKNCEPVIKNREMKGWKLPGKEGQKNYHWKENFMKWMPFKIDFELFLGISVAKNFEIDSWEYHCAVSIGFIEVFCGLLKVDILIMNSPVCRGERKNWVLSGNWKGQQRRTTNLFWVSRLSAFSFYSGAASR